MSERATKLIEQRQRAWDAAKAILDGAGDAELSAEQRSAYDKANADIDALDADIRSEVASEQRDTEFAKLVEQRGSVVPSAPKGAEDKREADSLLAEVRSFLRGEKRELTVMPAKPLTMAERRSLAKATAAAGGNTIQTSFYNQLVQHLIVNASLLKAGATVLTTGSGENIQIPKTTAHSGAALTAEAAAIAASDPTFGQITLGAFKYATLVQVTRELVEDTTVDLLGYLSMEMGRAVGNQAGADFVGGNGASKPRGILLDATTGITGGAGVAGAFTADNLIDLHYSVTAPYRNSVDCGWLMQDVTMGSVRKLKDSQNRYLWEPSLVVGAPDTLLGKPVHTDPNVPAVGLSAKSVVFGDLSRYFVREVNGVRFEQSNEFAFSSDLVTFKAVWRADGALIDLTGAVKTFVGNAA